MTKNDRRWVKLTRFYKGLCKGEIHCVTIETYNAIMKAGIGIPQNMKSKGKDK